MSATPDTTVRDSDALGEDHPIMEHEAIEPERLTLADRCCACGAQAFYGVRLYEHNELLLFCSHHANKHEAALHENYQPYQIIDQRHEVNAKPSVSV